MPATRSVVSWIAALHVAAVVVTSLCMPAALYFMLTNAADGLHERALRDQAEEIADHLVRHDNGRWELTLSPRLHELYSGAYGRYAYSVVDHQGAVLFTSMPGGRAVLVSDPLSGDAHIFRGQRESIEFFGASFPFVVQDAHVWVQVAQDMAHRDVLVDDIVSEFFVRVGWITATILLLLLAFEIVIIKRGLRPLVDASARAARIGPATVHIRLPEAGMPREVYPLVHAVNEALERIERGFRLQREFTADAAHELRTPLAILQARVDTLDDQRLKDVLRDDIATIGRIVGQLLAIAELETFVLDADEVADLRVLATRVAGWMAPLAERQRRSIVVTGDPGPIMVRASAELLLQALRNLVENALKHTPPATAVEIRVTGEPAIYVADDGPGIAAEERDLVFRRFWRRDRNRSGSSGLGLSIVWRIVEAHGAKISIDSWPGRGAVLAVRFPPSARIELDSEKVSDVADPVDAGE
jgi:signal transduction histidine kinase